MLLISKDVKAEFQLILIQMLHKTFIQNIFMSNQKINRV